MDQKNYTEIARIIKRTSYLQKVKVNIILVDRLANYFETESKEIKVNDGGIQIIDDDFDRQQFLLDCGV